MSSADQMRLRYARDQHLKSETEKFRDLNKIQAFVKKIALTLIPSIQYENSCFNKRSWKQDLVLQTNSQRHLYEMTEHRPKEPVKKMNSVSKFERMQQMQREEEEKRLEELRYSSLIS